MVNSGRKIAQERQPSLLASIFQRVSEEKIHANKQKKKTRFFEACVPFTRKKNEIKAILLKENDLMELDGSQTMVSTPASLGVRMRGVMPLLRSSSNASSWPMKLRLGETMGLRIFTNLQASVTVIRVCFIRQAMTMVAERDTPAWQ